MRTKLQTSFISGYRKHFKIKVLLLACALTSGCVALPGSMLLGPQNQNVSFPISPSKQVIARTVLDEAEISATHIKNPLQRTFAFAECGRLMGNLDEKKAQVLVAQAESALSEAERGPSLEEKIFAAFKSAAISYLANGLLTNTYLTPTQNLMNFNAVNFAESVARNMLAQEFPDIYLRLAEYEFNRNVYKMRTAGVSEVYIAISGLEHAQFRESMRMAKEARKEFAKVLQHARAAVTLAKVSSQPQQAFSLATQIKDREQRLLAMVSIVAKIHKLPPQFANEVLEEAAASVWASEYKPKAMEELRKALIVSSTKDASYMSTLAQSVFDPVSKSLAMQVSAHELAKSDPKRAVLLLKDSIETAFGLNDEDMKHLLVLYGIETLTVLDLPQALSFASRLNEPEVRTKALWRIAGQLAPVNQAEALRVLRNAIEWTSKMSDSKKRIQMFLWQCVALNTLDPKGSVQLYDMVVREIINLPTSSESVQAELADEVFKTARFLREGGIKNIVVPKDISEKRISVLLSAIAATKKARRVEERYLALWEGAAELRKWDAKASLPVFDEAIQLFEQFIMPKYHNFVLDDPIIDPFKALDKEIWPVLRIAARDLSEISRQRADNVFELALKTASELTIYEPPNLKKLIFSGRGGVFGVKWDPEPVRSYAKFKIASELAWIDKDRAMKLVETSQMPTGKNPGGLMGAGAAFGKAAGYILRFYEKPASSTDIVKLGTYFNMTMSIAEKYPITAADFYESALDTILGSQYDWFKIWEGISVVERFKKGYPLKQREKRAMFYVPGYFSDYFSNENDLSQKLLSSLNAVSQTEIWADKERRSKLLGKTNKVLVKVLSNYARSVALCSFASFLMAD